MLVRFLIVIGFGRDNWQEIQLNDPNTGVGYDDDGKVVARNTLVEVVRRPRTGPAAVAAPTPTLGPAGLTGVRNVMAEGMSTEGMSTEEALEAFAKGSAAGWQKEVKQAIVASKTRGRGRGVPPMDYRCPRCDAYGEHWLNECPTHGDPAYDRKRVRPPVGIPMTRLARSEEGGLVLPDGNTGTLVANEDAFAREVLGIGSLVAGEETGTGDVGKLEAGQQAQLQQLPHQAGIKLMSTAETLATANKAASAGGAGAAPVGFLPFSVTMIQGGDVPRLAGRSIGVGGEVREKRGDDETGEKNGKMKEKRDENFDANTAIVELVGAMDPEDERLFDLMRSQMLPQGPRDFLIEAYDREAAMGKEAFEKAQGEWRAKCRSRSRSQSKGRDSREWDARTRSRSRSPRGAARDDRWDRNRDTDGSRRDDRGERRDRYNDRYDDRYADRNRDRRERDRRDDLRRGGRDDDAVFTISNSRSRGVREGDRGDRGDLGRDRSRDRYDRRDDRGDRRRDEGRRDERGAREDRRRDDRGNRRRTDLERVQSKETKPRSALEVAARLLHEKRSAEKKSQTKREESHDRREKDEGFDDRERRKKREREREREETKSMPRKESKTEESKAPNPSDTSKHAPIVWTEPDVDEIVDYGASSDEEAIPTTRLSRRRR